MKDMIQRMTNLEAEKQQLNENEAGMPPMSAPMSAPAMDQGNPVSINVSMNASGKEHVADLLDMMKNAGLGDAEEVSAKTLSPRLDMERLKGIMDMPGKDEDLEMEEAPCEECGESPCGCDDEVEEWANSPEGSEGDPDYKDHHHMTKDLSGGINRSKKQYKAAQPGDNAMAMENIKEHLYNLLAEKKNKPDYLDFDKDGDKKEPMKKALKDKKKKAVSEDDKADAKMPSKAHIMKMCKDGKTKAEICKMHPNCDQGKLKDMIDDCMKGMKESADPGKMDEMGCANEMKKLYASGCTKEAMYKKINAQYNCGREKFEKLYASNCG